jgi:hypothetical protein
MYRTLWLLVGIAGLAAGQQIADFKDHVIESHIPGGYTVIAVDVNHAASPA